MARKTPAAPYQSLQIAKEQNREAKQRAAMHIAIAQRSAREIRGIRGVMDKIFALREAGFTYKEIGDEVADDLEGCGIEIPAKNLPSTIGTAYRAECADAEGVDEMIAKIDASRTLKMKILTAVEEKGGYGILTDPGLKEALIEAGILSPGVASDNPEERSLFRIAVMAMHYRRSAWQNSRERK